MRRPDMLVHAIWKGPDLRNRSTLPPSAAETAARVETSSLNVSVLAPSELAMTSKERGGSAAALLRGLAGTRRDLISRALGAPMLIVADCAPGLVNAIEQCWPPSDCQRCAVHRARNLYASARGIERQCRNDVAYRVITANVIPDHAAIARLLCRHEQPLTELFASVLRLCDSAGLVESRVVTIDGTKMLANANRDQNVDYDRIAREILEEAKAVDAAEDELYGERRGDELPEELATPEGRRAWLKHELARERAEDGESSSSERAEGDHEFDAEQIVARTQGREGWWREAKHQLERDRWAAAAPVPRGRAQRLLEGGRRLEDELAAKLRGNDAYEHYRATGRMKNGRRFGPQPNAYQPPESPEGQVNLTDPDSRLMKGFRSYLQGYNAQAAVNEHGIMLAAEITLETGDFSHLAPMVEATLRELDQASRETSSRSA
jgi:hypothetical protein